jgi:hypothetical protein
MPDYTPSNVPGQATSGSENIGTPGQPPADVRNSEIPKPARNAVPSGTDAGPSGTCPAAQTPGQAQSGTSGTVSEEKLPGAVAVADGARHPAPAEQPSGESFLSQSVPDRPDSARQAVSSAGLLPDVVLDAAPRIEGGASFGSRIVRGVFRRGPMTATRDTWDILENPTLAELFGGQGLPPDTVVEAEKGAQLTIIDGDVHHWPSPPQLDEIGAYLAAVTPHPDAAWRSHGGGVKLVYVGPNHEDKALAAALSLPRSFHVEILNHTRHPGATSSDHQGAVCSGLCFFDNDVEAPFEFRAVGMLTPELRAQAIAALGLEDGGRHDHDKCPLAGDAPSDAAGCVQVLDAGVFCYRCAAHGVFFSDGLAAGFYPFTAAIATPMTDLEALAKMRVHWAHARVVLRHRYQNLGEELLRLAYRKTLVFHYTANDPRIPAVFDCDVDVVWGDGVWLDARTLLPTKVDDDLVSGLPYCLDLDCVDGALVSCVNRIRRAQVKHRAPVGFTLIRPVRGISFVDDLASIPQPIPPTPRFPIELLADPLPEPELARMLADQFPQLNLVYLKSSVAAVICGETGTGQVPMLAATGPSGSGKEQTIVLAASILGQMITKLSLDEGEEQFFRQVGSACASGKRFLVLDEMAKTRNLATKLKVFLMLSRNIQWRPLYRNGLTSTRVYGAFFLPCVRFPDFVRQNEEMVRRTRAIHLFRKVPPWNVSCGCEISRWRDQTAENARVANSLLTIVWRECHERNYQFF